jgi:hypothetical protein
LISEIAIGPVPSAEGGMLARLLVAIDATSSPLERAIFRGDLAELVAETPAERRPLALLMLLVRVDRAQGDLPAAI